MKKTLVLRVASQQDKESKVDEKYTSWSDETMSWRHDDKTMSWDDYLEMRKKINVHDNKNE